MICAVRRRTVYFIIRRQPQRIGIFASNSEISRFCSSNIAHKSRRPTTRLHQAISYLMFSIRTLFFSLLLLETVTAADDCCKNVTSRQYHQQFVNKWLDFWNGNTSLLNGLAEPDMITYQDRVPSPTGNGSESVYINSSDGLSQGMVYALSPYESYYFNLVGWAGMDTHLAVRWRMDAVLGKGAMGM